MKNCRFCNCELIEGINWSSPLKKAYNYVCNGCNNKKSFEYRKTHPYKKYTDEIHKERKRFGDKKYYEKNREKILKHNREYSRIYNIIQRKKRRLLQKNYRHTLNGKIITKRAENKHRELGWSPLNGWFNESHGHHINFNDVIYIPKEWNLIVSHNVHTGKNMDIVNAYAFFFLLQQNINDLNKIFKGD